MACSADDERERERERGREAQFVFFRSLSPSVLRLPFSLPLLSPHAAMRAAPLLLAALFAAAAAVEAAGGMHTTAEASPHFPIFHVRPPKGHVNDPCVRRKRETGMGAILGQAAEEEREGEVPQPQCAREGRRGERSETSSDCNACCVCRVCMCVSCVCHVCACRVCVVCVRVVCA